MAVLSGRQKTLTQCVAFCACRKVKAIEFMVCEALALAQAPLGLREAVENTSDISLYLNLDDSLLPRLQALRLDPHDEHYDAVQQVRTAQHAVV
jgi:hypothetical protein